MKRINILGNNITNEAVVRWVIVRWGEFTKLNLDKSISRIKSRNIFRSVKPKISDGSSADLKLDINVEEKATGEMVQVWLVLADSVHLIYKKIIG